MVAMELSLSQQPLGKHYLLSQHLLLFVMYLALAGQAFQVIVRTEYTDTGW